MSLSPEELTSLVPLPRRPVLEGTRWAEVEAEVYEVESRGVFGPVPAPENRLVEEVEARWSCDGMRDRRAAFMPLPPLGPDTLTRGLDPADMGEGKAGTSAAEGSNGGGALPEFSLDRGRLDLLSVDGVRLSELEALSRRGAAVPLAEESPRCLVLLAEDDDRPSSFRKAAAVSLS